MYKIHKEKAIRMVLYKQHLYHHPSLSGKDGISQLLNDVGLIQIDTIHVVSRSHNLFFLSRLKEYNESDLIDLYHEKQVFESYIHAMSLLPIEQFHYVSHRLHEFREALFSKLQPEETDLLLSVYHKIVSDGPLSTKEVGSAHDQSVGPLASWELSPVRWALDQLWRSGMIQVIRDSKFNKSYLATKDWFPKEAHKPSEDEIYKHYCLSALKAMGVSTVKDIADYYRLPANTVNNTIQELLKEKKIKSIEIEDLSETYFLRQEDEELLSNQALDEEPTHMCFLSPFDNLIWYRIRLLNLFEVDYRLESYLPKNKRKYGYYAMPILIRGKIIGTIDLKLDRKRNTLYVQNIFLYNPCKSNFYKKELQTLLNRYANFLNAKTIFVSDEFMERARSIPSLDKFIRSIF